jgi:hypothetical protein
MGMLPAAFEVSTTRSVRLEPALEVPRTRLLRSGRALRYVPYRHPRGHCAATAQKAG